MDHPPYQFSHFSLAGGYAGLYRSSETEPYEIIVDPETGRRALFETSIKAERAARDFVAALHAKPAKREPDRPDVLEVAKWKDAKATIYAESQLIRRTGEFKPFTVERRRRGKAIAKQTL